MPEITCLRTKYSAFEKKECKEPGSFAKLRLKGHRNKIILKADSLENNKKMCDYFVFIHDSNLVIVILELKEKNLKCEDVYKKMENGSFLVSKLHNECCREIKNNSFFPIFLHHGGRWPSEIKMLRKKTISFLGRSHPIICEEGIVELSEIIKNY